MNEKTKHSCWLFILAVAIAICFWLAMSGCKSTCPPPTVIEKPVEVKVPVPVPPEPIPVPPPPEYEVCDQEDATAALQCIGRNIQRLRLYADALLVEIEAANAAIE